MKAGLDFFYPRMPRGGLFLLHDYSSLCWPGAKQAVDEFCRATGENLLLMPDKSGSAFIRKK
jgi:O-methyltransferase